MSQIERSPGYRRTEKKILSDSFSAELAARIVRDADARERAPTGIWAMGLAAAAVVVLAVGLFFYTQRTPDYPGLTSYSAQSVAAADQTNADWNETDSIISSALENR
jgi:predicted membrane-bound mannosyltransferase